MQLFTGLLLSELDTGYFGNTVPNQFRSFCTDHQKRPKYNINNPILIMIIGLYLIYYFNFGAIKVDQVINS